LAARTSGNARQPWIHLSFLHRLPSCEVLNREHREKV
jgi:hypothetical protein